MKKMIVFLLAFAASLSLSAQNSLSVEAPNVVALDETFRVVFTGNAKMSDFDWAGTDDFSIVWGPQKGSMSSTSIINGKRTSTHQETVTYLLIPKSEGSFTLPAATANVGGDICSSKGFSIEVVKGSGQGSAQTASGQQGQSQPQAGSSSFQGSQSSAGTSSSEGDVFLRMTVNKTNVVKGEPVTATLKVYTRVDIESFEDIHFPSFNGFWSKETISVQNLEFNRENVDGAIYNSAVVRQYMLIPQQSGKLSIDPAEMTCHIRIRTSPGGMRSIFDDFFDTYQTVRKRIATPSITISVKDLPAGAPDSFSGAVGDFRIEASVSKDALKANEAASLTVTVTGTGNVSMLETPKVKLPSDFEVYDIKSSEKISANGSSGSKTFEYPFIPRSHGDFTIEPIEYSYYDIAKGKYITIQTEPIELHIEKGEEIEGGGSLIQGVNRQGVRNLAEDIRYIALGDGNFKAEGRFFAGSPLFFILLALIVGLYFAILKLLGIRDRRRADIVGAKNRKANKMARTRLKIAETYLKQDLKTAYYEELHKALLGYVSDKLTIPMADLSKETVRERLSEKGVSSQTVEDLTALVDKCEFARYAPETGAGEMKSEYDEAVSVISRIESEMKNTKSSARAFGSSVVIALMLTISSSLSAQESASELWNRGNEAFSRSEWQSALEAYRAIESEGLQSADLYYNMGNACFKMGETGYAILYFEKALKIDPSHPDAANNLAIASQLTLDKIEAVPEFVLKTWIRDIRNGMSADAWAWMTLLLAAIVAGLMIVFVRASSNGLRKSGFVLACIAAVIAVFTLTFSLTGRAAVTRTDNAVVTAPVSSVKSSPAEGGMSIFVLHEGTKVTIHDTLGEWTKIELADGRQGWISTPTITVI